MIRFIALILLLGSPISFALLLLALAFVLLMALPFSILLGLAAFAKETIEQFSGAVVAMGYCIKAAFGKFINKLTLMAYHNKWPNNIDDEDKWK